jgi:hypothetical protein
MNITVATAAIGTKETPPPPAFRDSRIAYYCATDRPAIEGWQTVGAASIANPRKLARMTKIFAAQGFHESSAVIWVDASFAWLVSPLELAKLALAMDVDIAAFRHPDRNRITEEAAEVQRLGMAPVGSVNAQIAAYRAAGFDTDERPQEELTTTGLMVFCKRSPAMLDFLDLWREQIDSATVRDQLSVDYCAWKTGARIGYLPGHYRANDFVRYERERHRRAA